MSVFDVGLTKKGSKFKLVKKDISTNEIDKSSIIVSDGKYFISYHATKGSGDTSSKNGRAVRNVLEETGDSTIYDPIFLKNGLEQSLALEELFAKPNTKVHQNMEEFNGLACWRIDIMADVNNILYYHSYWLCPDRSFWPIKWEVNDTDGRLVSQIEIESFIELDYGLFFPEKIIIKKPRAYGVKNAVCKGEYSIKRVLINKKIDDKVFDASPSILPTGALVQDFVIKMEYHVGENPDNWMRIEETPIGVKSCR